MTSCALVTVTCLPGVSTATPDNPQAAAREPDQALAKGTLPEVQPAKAFPWKLGAEHRYIWLRDGQKVGETVFRLEAEGRAAPTPGASKAPEGTSPPSYLLTASRTYDRDGFSQRGAGKTRIRPDGTPLAFEESLDTSTIQNLSAHQETSIRFESGRALVTYVPNQKTEAAVRQDLELPRDAFLYANQAVEHWAIFASRIQAEPEKQSLRLFYPDFSKVFEVTFRKTGEETLRIGTTDIEARRYAFQSNGNELKGGIWLDRDGKLVQVEFPNSSKETAVRVVLDPK
jgi:hypothetical protein